MFRGNHIRAGVADHRVGLEEMLFQGGGVNASRNRDGTLDISNTHDLHSAVGEEPHQGSAHLAVSLNDDALADGALTEVAQGGEGADGDTHAGGSRVAQSATDGQRLARHDPERVVTAQHGNGVHNPAHHLGVGVDIGGRNVPVRPNELCDVKGVTTRQSLQLAA